jgi:hypothetical protein
MCLRRAPQKYIAGAMAPTGAALDRAVIYNIYHRDKYLSTYAWDEHAINLFTLFSSPFVDW